MKSSNRFIKSIIATSAKTDTTMPWTRGKRRAAFIAGRLVPTVTRKSA